jgi:hypothetical protein
MSSEPAVICAYDSEFEANLAIGALADVGIVACILNPINRISYVNMIRPIPLRLAVRAEDADAAREVLRSINAGDQESQVETKRRLGKKARPRPAG